MEHLDDQHTEVQIRIPCFRAYKVLRVRYTTGPMQRSRTDRPTTLFDCEGVDEPVTNLDCRFQGPYRFLTFSATQSRIGVEQMYIISNFSNGEALAESGEFDEAMSSRCSDCQQYLATAIERTA